MKFPLHVLLCGVFALSTAVSSRAVDVTLVAEGDECDYLVPSVSNGGNGLGLTWTEESDPANFDNWTKGATTGIGYDEQPTYRDFISTDVEAVMLDRHPSIYIRIKFEIADAEQLASFSSLTLNMRSDDGFIAYLNGTRVAERNPPASPAWNSTSNGTTNDGIARQLLPFDVSGFIDELKVGTNVLALHGLNASNSSSDFLISPQLVASDFVPPEPRVIGITNGFSRPVDIQNAGDGSGRLFIVEKLGRVRIVNADGTLLPTPFLDISGPVDSIDNEEGLLGLAFPPDFATKQHFYVYYTGPVAPGGGGVESDSILSRFSVSEGNPNVADAGSEEVILRVGQPFWNHNGGQIQFGPDGFIYIAFGDGGSGNDPGNRSQNRQSLLGKMVRIDVEGEPDPGLAYAIPPSNPFVGDASTLDEIWALGLRNPFRFSFDRLTGDMYIGDVGQGAWEEMDFEPAGDPGGRNYGWRWWEGNATAVTSGPEPTNVTFPVHEYGTRSDGNCSIIAGYVYRGTRFPRMSGIHFFGDYCNEDLRGLRRVGEDEWEARSLIDLGFEPTSFGEDEDGELYVVADTGAGSTSLFRIEDSRDVNYLKNIATGETPDGRPTVTVGVAVGEQYQLQVSSDLKTWQDAGAPVVATDLSLDFELPIGNFNPPRQYMRVAELN